jgi:tellurite resistance protein TerC
MTTVKRFVIGAAGGAVLLVGLAMVVLPGPAFIVIPIGLAILATEFAWAKRWLEKAKEKFANARSYARRSSR